jgi:hypothetical protein
MSDMDFEAKLKQAAEQSVLRIISDGSWVMPDYGNRFKLPADFMAGVWGLVDGDSLKAQLARRLEAELADRIVNHLAAEIATDIKQLLSDKERREALRALARQHIDSLAGKAS